jgi:PAS domain S-box-containing protein
MEIQLTEARDELEKRVNERTTELSEALSVLQEEAEQRIKIQNELQASEAKYRELVENANSIIMRRDVSGKITFFNEFAQKFFGFSEDEIIDRNIVGTIVAKTYASGQNLADVIENIGKYPEIYQNNENENIRKNGEKVWVAWTNKALTDDKGRIVELLCVGNDITERKRIETRIRVTNYLLELFAQKSTRKEYLDSVVGAIHDWSECSCVGIRLTTTEGLIPYESCVGFSEEFLSLENVLSLEKDTCACVRAITQSMEPQDAVITSSRGSFFCNNTLQFLNSLNSKEKSRFRGNCARAGFASIAVIPVRYRQQILGALHLADQKQGRISHDNVDFLENMALLIGEAVHRFDMESALRESEERYRHLVEVSPDGIGVEIDDKIVFINTAGAKLLGCSKSEELIGKTVVDFLHPDRRRVSQKQLQYLRNKKKALPLREERFMRVDGSFLDVEVATTPLVYQNKPATQIIFRDITERKLAEGRILADQKQLRLLTSELVLAEERERHEIATALHDSIGPILAFSKRELGTLQKTAPPELAESLRAVSDNITHAVKQTRTLTFDLSPPTLYTFGFDAAIEELTEHFCQEHKLGYSFHNSKAPKPLTDHVKILLYRSTREMLINIAKHAKARFVKVSVAAADNDIQVTIEDDGKGFNVSALHARSSKSRGLGLFSVRERLTHIGGKLEIESAHGKGTKVTLSAPLKPEENHKKEN